MKVLDLFCGGGGAATGIHHAMEKAGIEHEIHGVDIRPQPHYPFIFHQADALTLPLEEYDFYWASPPCQAYTRMSHGLLQSLNIKKQYPELIEPVRVQLQQTGKPYIIENVEGANLINPALICGSFFGLQVQRHRLFESNMLLFSTPCAHYTQVKDKYSLHRFHGTYSRVIGVYGHNRVKGGKASWEAAMGIDWMTSKELTQAIPPAYSEFLMGQWLENGTVAKAVRKALSTRK